MALSKDFMEIILPEDLESAKIGIFTLPERKSRWFKTGEDAGQYAEAMSGKQNVYFTLAAYKSGIKSGRGTEKDTVGLLAVGIDIDLADPLHSKENLPKSETEIMEVIREATPGMLPTVTINSGHGIQVFYCFKEPWLFEDPGERVQAKQLCADIRNNYLHHLAKRGYTLDSTFDLARVMRVAGTLNIKDPNNPKEVKILEESGMRYNPDDFEQIIITEGRKTIDDIVQSKPGSEFNLKLDSTATPPTEKMEAMLDDSNFLALWTKSLDKKIEAECDKAGREKDASLSVYDYRLCTEAVKYGWSPQEMANLIIAFRNKHAKKPEDLHKALRVNYIERTIRKARGQVTQAEQLHQVTSVADAAKSIEKNERAGQPVDEKRRDKVRAECLAKVSEYIGDQVKSLRKYMSEPPVYEFLLEEGNVIRIGTSKELLNQNHVRNKVFDALAHVPKGLKKDNWEALCTLFGFIQEELETAPETRESDRMEEWINDYIYSLTMYDSGDESFVNDKGPFTDEDGKTYIFGNQLRDYIITTKSERMGSKDFGLTMRRLGCKAVRKNFVKRDGQRTTAMVYEVTPVTQRISEGLVN